MRIYRGMVDDVVRKDLDWAEEAKRLLKAEIKRSGLTYADLVEELAKFDVHETEPNVRNRISRGHFSAAFFLQCLAALKRAYIDISPFYEYRPPTRIAWEE